MVIMADDKILIRDVRLHKKEGGLKNFRRVSKQKLKVCTIKRFAEKIDKTGDEQRNPGSGGPRTVRVNDNYSRRPYSELG